MLRIPTASNFFFRNIYSLLFPAVQRLVLSRLVQVVLALICFAPVLKGATTVTLQWDNSLDESIASYKVYYGPSDNIRANEINTGKVNLLTVSTLIPGNTYYFSVTSVNTAGMESPPSNEVTFTALASPAEIYPDAETAALFDVVRQTLIAIGLNNAAIMEIEQHLHDFYLGQLAAAASSGVAAAASPPPPAVPLTIETLSPAENFDESLFSNQEGVITGSLDVKVSEMALSEEGGWSFAVLAPGGAMLEIYGSSDLTTWELLDTLENPLGMILITETQASDFPQQYYRVLPVDF